jgi:hypothetical protein
LKLLSICRKKHPDKQPGKPIKRWRIPRQRRRRIGEKQELAIRVLMALTTVAAPIGRMGVNQYPSIVSDVGVKSEIV